MKSNLEWQKWGKTDPLYAVSSWPDKQIGGRKPWTDSEFYTLGESDWKDFAVHWRNYGLRPGRCLEIGCGAGRMTRQLAGEFQKVEALDVSPEQIEYAKSHIGKENVSFAVTDGITVPLPDNSADAVFSVHVFQHFDSPEDALRVLREVHRVLAPGGTFMIHMPLLKLPNLSGAGVLRFLIKIIDRLKRWKAALQRRRGKLIMRMLWYDAAWLTAPLEHIGYSRFEWSSFAVHSNGAVHDFLFATKATKPKPER